MRFEEGVSGCPRRRVLATCAAAIGILGAAAAWGQPANDNCAGATPVAVPGSVISSNVGATSDFALPLCVDSFPANDVYFSVVGDGTTYTATTCNAGTTFDTTLEVFCGDCGGLLCVIGNDDDATCSFSTLRSTVSFCTAPGVTYFLVVSGYFGATGTIELSVATDGLTCFPAACGGEPGACCALDGSCSELSEIDCITSGGAFGGPGVSCDPNPCPQPLPNDTCDTAEVIPSVPFTTFFDNSLNGGSAPAGSCNASGTTTMDNDVWYTYTPPADCLLLVTVDSTVYDFVFAVYEGTSCAALAEVACGDEPQPTTVSVNAMGGVTYWIQIGDWGTTDGGGATTLNVDCVSECVTCPEGAIIETEPDCGLLPLEDPIDSVNGGCNSTPPVFQTLTCGDTFCGTAGANVNFRDTDWFEVVLTEDTRLTWTVRAEFPALVGILDNDGVADCNQVDGFLAVAETTPCADGIVSACVPAGTWWLIVAPANFADLACGAAYTASLTCDTCEVLTGACCLGDGSCMVDNPFACEAAGGLYQGDFSVCEPNPCPQVPENDTCETAAAIGALPAIVTGNTTLASDDLTGTCVTSAPFDTVWYSVTGTGNTITATTCSFNSDYDTKLWVLCGDCAGGLSCVTGNDDDFDCAADTLLSTVSWCSSSGVTYYIAVGGFSNGNGGNFELLVSDDGLPCSPGACSPVVGACCFLDGSCLELAGGDCTLAGGTPQGDGTTCEPNPCPQPVDGELCSNAVEITSVPFSTSFDNSTLSGSAAEGSCNSGDGTMDNDMWFSWSPTEPCNARLTVTPVGDAYDAIVAVYAGADCGSLSEIACGDEPQPIVVEFLATPGQTYWFQIGDWGVTDGGGPTDLLLECLAASGACCTGSGCSIVTESACTELGGEYQGDFTTCGDPAGAPSNYSDPTGLPAAIPDNDPLGVAHTISVPDSFAIGDVNVNVSITHTYISDLEIIVTHGAVSVTVWANSCFGENNLIASFDDEGGVYPCPPAGGSYQPDNALSAFDGMDAAGDWTIFIADSAGADVGTLDSWSLDIDGLINSPCDACAGVTEGDSNGDGLVNFDDIDCFVSALISQAAWETCGTSLSAAQYVCANDIDDNGSVNFDDIDPFIICLIMGTCP